MSEFFDWDSPIENDEQFTLLPAGDYDFTVKSFSRSEYTPRNPQSSKIPACKAADFVLVIQDPATGAEAEIEDRIFMLKRFEWKMCAFFTAIGQRKKGERLVPNWQAAIGARGRCTIGVRKYTGTDGREYSENQITAYLEPAEPAWTPPAASQTAGGWSSGKF